MSSPKPSAQRPLGLAAIVYVALLWLTLRRATGRPEDPAVGL
ncbi:hypothetical protein [Leucobacter sp. G161]|nr:hypothetical protein [Leucobacter sp. G161]